MKPLPIRILASGWLAVPLPMSRIRFDNRFRGCDDGGDDSAICCDDAVGPDVVGAPTTTGRVRREPAGRGATVVWGVVVISDGERRAVARLAER